MTGPEDQEENLQELLREIASTHMPFGKFGPDHFPPHGIRLCDLPYEYLRFFERKGFPRGRLGHLLQVVHRLKQDGADSVFDPFRNATGGRQSLRRPKRRHWEFNPGSQD
jgi:uncharacterized protein (DUF3820 family)